jgi:hypothetical protein
VCADDDVWAFASRNLLNEVGPDAF